ncbi:MAG: hypothetical protein IJY72_05980, partial [Akkermansia sp.]|nr:hypothetical protein [Akkermansia sp.]
MKAGTIVTTALALLVAAGVTYAVKPELLRDYLPGGLTSQLDKMLGHETGKKTGKKGAKKAVTIKNIGIIKGAELVDCLKVRDKVAAEIAQKIGTPT